MCDAMISSLERESLEGGGGGEGVVEESLVEEGRVCFGVEEVDCVSEESAEGLVGGVAESMGLGVILTLSCFFIALTVASGGCSLSEEGGGRCAGREGGVSRLFDRFGSRNSGES